MKRFSFLTGIVSAFLLTCTAYGWLQPSPCKFGFQAEYLYLLPSVDDNFFVVQSTTAGLFDGDGYHNRFNFHSGVRLEGAYVMGCPEIDARLRWTYLNAKHTRTVSGTNLFATEGVPTTSIVTFAGTADSQVKVHYDNVEALFGTRIFGGCGCSRLSLYGRGGFQYAAIRYKENVVYNSGVALNDITYRHHVWGFGPEISFDGTFNITHLNCWLDNCLAGNLFVTARASAGLLASKHNNDFEQVATGAATVSLNDKHLWRVTPAWHLRLGLSYATRLFCCVCSSFEVGYEFTSFCHAISKTRFNDDIMLANSFRQYMNFNLHGPYAAVAFTF